ncbi:MAG: hypothetical protein WAU53_15740 [Rhodoplanes sp.]
MLSSDAVRACLSASRFRDPTGNLGDANSGCQFHLREIAKLPQHADRVLAIGESVSHLQRQQRSALSNVFPRLSHKARRAGIFFGFRRKRDKALVFGSLHDRHVAVRRCLETDFHHDLSLADISPMADGHHDDCVAFLIEAAGVKTIDLMQEYS